MAPHPFDKVDPAVRALFEEVRAMRREFHRYPELSWQEAGTQRRILEFLGAIEGLEDVRPIAKTGATALIRGRSLEPCVLWRADIDALPVPEQTGLDFASEMPGVMHACGHDTHIAIALGIARLLAGRRAELPGSVRFVFQPAEEACGGAEACIAEGVLTTPYVARALGLHISADLSVGTINVAPGPFFAAPTTFTIRITGRGGHAAAPHQAVDTVVVAAHVITALQTIVSRSIGPTDAAVLTVGKVEAGYRGNVIAESAVLEGTIRTYTDDLRDAVVRRVEEVLTGVCAAFGAEFDFAWDTTCPPLVNDEQATALVVREAEQFFGRDRIVAAASMGAEDMSVFLEARPGCFFWLGARHDSEVPGRHHDSGFVIDESALLLGVDFGARVIEATLRELTTG